MLWSTKILSVGLLAVRTSPAPDWGRWRRSETGLRILSEQFELAHLTSVLVRNEQGHIRGHNDPEHHGRVHPCAPFVYRSVGVPGAGVDFGANRDFRLPHDSCSAGVGLPVKTLEADA